MVTAVDRGRFSLHTDDGANLLAVKARELGRKGVVVGDSAWFVGQSSGDLARIVRLDPRATVLRRTADDSDPVERVIVANADALAVVTSVTDPPPRPRLIDRALVAAFDAGLRPLLVITKADLADPGPLIESYAALDIDLVTIARGPGKTPEAAGLQRIREILTDQVTVLVGHSGVGKSTLVNALVPGADRSTGAVNAVTGRGRHTSTSAIALRLPEGGWIIDTPGVRSFGLAHVSRDSVIRAFADLADGLAACPRGCTHDEPECGLDAFVAGDPAGQARLTSLRRLLRVDALPDHEGTGMPGADGPPGGDDGDGDDDDREDLGSEQPPPSSTSIDQPQREGHRERPEGE
jgi:ribosome biogenesis GTPase / thiamine phosphate phosphatase